MSRVQIPLAALNRSHLFHVRNSVNSQTQATVNAIATDAAPKTGIAPADIIKIIADWLPVALQCFALLGTGQTTKSYVTDHYDETKGEYDQSLVEQNRHRMRRSARQNGQKHLSSDQLDALSVAAFDHARLTDESTAASVMAEINQNAGFSGNFVDMSIDGGAAVQ